MAVRFCKMALAAIFAFSSQSVSASDSDDPKKRVRSYRVRVDQDGNVTSAGALSDLPEDVRERVEERVREATERAEKPPAAGERQTTTTITVIDRDGNKRVQKLSSDGPLPRRRIAEVVRKAFGDDSIKAAELTRRIEAAHARMKNRTDPREGREATPNLDSKLDSILARLDQIEADLAKLKAR